MMEDREDIEMAEVANREMTDGDHEEDIDDHVEEDSLLATRKELEQERMELHKTRKMLDRAKNEMKSLKCFAALTFIGICIFAPSFLFSKPAPKPWTKPPREWNTDFLCVGDRMHPGDKMHSQNKLFELYFQDDGNLVIYNRNNSCTSNTPKCAIWASNTNGQAPRKFCRFEFQKDKNLVIYPNSNFYNEPALWSSHTNLGSMLRLQNTGILQLLKADGTQAWKSNNKRVKGLKNYKLPASIETMCLNRKTFKQYGSNDFNSTLPRNTTKAHGVAKGKPKKGKPQEPGPKGKEGN